MANIEGQLRIDLHPQRGKGARVALSSNRPLLISKIFIGKTPKQVLSTISLLFNICGIAQSRAALASIEQSLEHDIDPALESARDMLVLTENAKEHLLRIFIDWPKLFNLKTSHHKLPYLNQITDEFKSTLFQDSAAFTLDSKLNRSLKNVVNVIDKLELYLQQHIFCNTTKNWLSITNVNDLRHWARQNDNIATNSINFIFDKGWALQGLANCEPLPILDKNYLLQQFNAHDAEQFIAQPRWQEHCCETTTLTRQIGQPLIQVFSKEFHATLITRWIARLVELASIPHQLRIKLRQITNGFVKTPLNIETNHMPTQGLTQVEAARGRLIHCVSVKQGVISNYQILAPTEWNFHPQGLAARCLDNLITSNKKDLRPIAHLLINVIDPCIGYTLRIH